MTDDILGAALVASDHALGNALEAITDADLSELLGGIEQLKGLRTSLATVSAELEHRAGVLMDADSQTVDGVEWVRSKPAPSKTGWQTDDLKRAVLDSRLADDNGEIVDESPLDKVLHVWNLGAPRSGALKDRGIQADEFCTVTFSEDRRWRVMKAADKKGRGKR